LAGVGSCALLIAAWSSGAWAGEATEAMRDSSLEVQSIMADEEMAKPEHDQDRWRRLEQSNATRFNYEEMAKRALGTQWSALNEREREEYVAAFQNFMSAVYSKLQGTAGKYVQYLNERREADYTEVRTVVPSYKAEIALDYRLMNNDGGWRVYDMVLDGVSMVDNYREQFSRIIKQSSSFQILVDKLRTHSLEVRY
jgi:phospholipid transport system substrate-binding protein